MQYVYDDGGRKDSGYKGSTGDCVTRAIAIATGLSYQEVYDQINQMALAERIGKRKRKRSNARLGVYRTTYHKYLLWLGWEWKACTGIGLGCQVHLDPSELPDGTLICRLSRHTTTVIDGVIHDTYDPSRNGTRCVYGYYRKPQA